MFQYGKLLLTHSGIMLDEVRSLLQKSLRRKDRAIALSCLRELTQYERDQLPTKSLVTFLFEDHCLCDEHILTHLYNLLFVRKRKDQYVLTLLECPTSRIAACLPVVALDRPYHCWSESMQKGKHGLVEEEVGKLDADIVLSGLLWAWTEKKEKDLVAYMKLAQIMHDQERRHLTADGKSLVSSLRKRGRPQRVGHLIIAFLHQNTLDNGMRNYLEACFHFATDNPDCLRLILSAIVTQLLYREYRVRLSQSVLQDNVIEWDTVDQLRDIPDYAVDKHTYRGSRGLETRRYLPGGIDLTEQQLIEYHGKRKQRGLLDFFQEGVLEFCPARDNPYWERTQEIYMCYDIPKTNKMTLKFMDHLKDEHEWLFCYVHLPLLHVPAYKGKVFTRIDISNRRVIKGPYARHKFALCVFFHSVMKNIFKDVHTLDAKGDFPYVSFPLVTRKNVYSITPHKEEVRIFDDVNKVDIVTREDLGIIQVNRLVDTNLPKTLIVHFIYRYLIGVGDSSLVNAIWDGDNYYGIDMEEKRGHDGTCLISCLFSHKPIESICLSVTETLKLHNEYILGKCKETMDKVKDIEATATTQDIVFDAMSFRHRVYQIMSLIGKL